MDELKHTAQLDLAYPVSRTRRVFMSVYASPKLDGQLGAGRRVATLC